MYRLAPRKAEEEVYAKIDEVARRKRKFTTNATVAVEKAKVHFEFTYILMPLILCP